jgi:hypothetical protein
MNIVKPKVEIDPTTEAAKEDGKKQVNEFPNKVDKMLDQINALFFNGEVDIHNKVWLKKMAKQHNIGQGDDEK